VQALVAWHHADFRGTIDSTDGNVLSSLNDARVLDARKWDGLWANN
jgi:hypothetical protein